MFTVNFFIGLFIGLVVGFLAGFIVELLTAHNIAKFIIKENEKLTNFVKNNVEK